VSAISVAESSSDRAVLLPRVLAVSVAERDVSALLPICDVQFIPTWSGAAPAMEQAAAEGRPFSLMVMDYNSASWLAIWDLLQPLWRMDPALQTLFFANSFDPVHQDQMTDRCIVISSPSDPIELRQIAGILIRKSATERQLQQTAAELADLKGRRSIEIAAANADLISLNRKLESAKDAAETANRAKSAFLATMSHEIRTPMTAILGYADYLLEEGDIRQAPLERIEAINTIVRNGRHLVQLINDILDLSKIEANRVDVERILCKPLAIVTDVVSLMRGRADEKMLQLRTATDGPIPEVILSDPTRLRQILVNVIGNAIKFTERGSVTISARYLVENDRRFIQFEVADTGIGLTREQLERLFLPFSQADMSMTRRFGGTGLGLCISQRFAEMLGGRIEVSSELGRGTSFRISICTGDIEPTLLVTNDALREAAQEDPYAIAEARRVELQMEGRILIAEDGIDNQRLFAHLLRKSGADVTVVSNGELACEAVEAAAARHEPFDVVLMDMQMPVLDGYAATRRLRAAGCELPVIALTAFAMTGDREKCMQAGCTDYLTKPIDRTVMLPLIAQYAKQAVERRMQTPSRSP
jgi:signal transduction histidine kinase/ActR/RegA family two-component response regulator